MELSGGVLRLSWNQGTYIGIDVATAALAAIETLCQGKQLPMLVGIGGVTHSAAARKLFPSHSNISRLALVGTTPKDRMIAMFRLPLAPARFPIRYFTTEGKALEWLREGYGEPAD